MEMNNIDEESVGQILREQLGNTTKVCAKTVPEILRGEQKDGRRQMCADIPERKRARQIS